MKALVKDERNFPIFCISKCFFFLLPLDICRPVILLVFRFSLVDGTSTTIISLMNSKWLLKVFRISTKDRFDCGVGLYQALHCDQESIVAHSN